MNREDAELRELRRVQKYATASSLTVVLPKRFTDVLEIKKGDYVKMILRNKTIILEKYVP